MGRSPCCDKDGIKKGPWTPEEDIILVSYIQQHGPANWRSVPTNTGIFVYVLSLFLFFMLSCSRLECSFIVRIKILTFFYFCLRVEEVIDCFIIYICYFI